MFLGDYALFNSGIGEEVFAIARDGDDQATESGPEQDQSSGIHGATGLDKS